MIRDANDLPGKTPKAFFGIGSAFLDIPEYVWTLPALVLLGFALRDALREKRRMPGQRGPKQVLAAVIVGILLVAARGSVVAWYEIRESSKASFKATLSKNQADASDVFLHIRGQIGKYFKTHSGYPRSLQNLVTESLLPQEWASELIHGYRFEYEAKEPIPIAGGSADRYTKFSLIAKPQSPSSGQSVFTLNESGKIRVYESSKPDAAEFYALEAPEDWGAPKRSSIEPSRSKKQ